MNIKPESASQEADINDDKTFITKLLGEMKTQFNSSEKKITSETENEENPCDNNIDTADGKVLEEEINEIICDVDNVNNDVTVVTVEDTKDDVKVEVKEEMDSTCKTDDCEDKVKVNGDDEKPRLLMKFIKPANKTLGKRKLKNGENNEKVVEEVNLKRSSRRRSSESILQSAIARKEKSYNESMKPQRSSRQLKPTQKILDNLANAALKLEKNKIKSPKFSDKQKYVEDMETDTSDDKILGKINMNDEHRKYKHKNNSHKYRKNAKRMKNNECKDSDSDYTNCEYKDDPHDKCNGRNSRSKLSEEKMYRRSQRLSSRYVQ